MSDAAAIPATAAFDRDALIDCSRGEVFGPGNFRLRPPPALRIIRVAAAGGAFGQGSVRGERALRTDRRSFDQPPGGEAVMPASLGLEALWELMGFFLAWRGAPGLGRPIAVADFRVLGFAGPEARLIEYGLDFRTVKRTRVTLGVADGWITVDGHLATTARTLKYGLFNGEQRPMPGVADGRGDALAIADPHARARALLNS
ncbi:MAG: bifunctional 3-hydroxydecanoyl-ACP dehydratase/trans-2-decenoyl-ACP isomerase [Microvirga sp.]